MGERLRSLLSGWSLPGWAVMAVAIINFGSNLETLIAWMSKFNRFSQNHLGLSLVIGFVWLAAVVCWPEIGVLSKRWIPVRPTTNQRITELERDRQTLHARIQWIIGSIPSFSLCVAEACALSFEFAAAIELFNEIRCLHPDTGPASFPLSRWWPNENDGSVASGKGARLAMLLANHIRHADVFAMHWGQEILPTEFRTHVDGWQRRNDRMSGEEFQRLMISHGKSLDNLSRRDVLQRFKP